MKWPIMVASPLLAGLVLAPAITLADHCEGRLPTSAGELFAAVVRYVGDGDNLCLRATNDPASWIEVRLSDFDASELHSATGRVPRNRLSSLVRGRILDWVAVRAALAGSSRTIG